MHMYAVIVLPEHCMSSQLAGSAYTFLILSCAAFQGGIYETNGRNCSLMNIYTAVERTDSFRECGLCVRPYQA